ncbi:MAG TPA: hypothetical protein VG992_04560 [Candidatus Saccharimonadales bacterium]|nr:hypothetical protein [Candidatus Saccharimonadales bacterium]
MESLDIAPAPTPEDLAPKDLSADDPFDYKIMAPQRGHTYVENTPEYQEKYIYMLSQLVDDAMGDPETRADTLVFLDKSARPLAWMMRTFWDEIAPQERDQETGELRVIPMPKMRFATVDRLEWRKDPKKEFIDGGAKEITQANLDGLRAIFSRDDQHGLDHDKIYVIDEQSESGDTLDIAKQLFTQAFPDATVRGRSFIQHPYVDNPKTGERTYKIQEIPPWYPLKSANMTHQDIRGRGVFDAIPYYRRSDRFRARFPEESNQFLSSPPRTERVLTDEEVQQADLLQMAFNAAKDDAERNHLAAQLEHMKFSENDPKSDRLRKEIGRMLVDYQSGKLTPSVATERETVRGLPVAEYTQERDQARQERAQASRRR